jgi:hypothetical protein
VIVEHAVQVVQIWLGGAVGLEEGEVLVERVLGRQRNVLVRGCLPVATPANFEGNKEARE